MRTHDTWLNETWLKNELQYLLALLTACFKTSSPLQCHV